MSEIKRIKTISEVHAVYGFDQPRHPLVSVLPIDERMTAFDYANDRYAFDFYQISLKEGIKGTLIYGRNTYDFQEGTMTFIKPNQVLRIENSETFEGRAGWTLLFHPDLIRKSELGRNIDTYSFFGYEANEALHLSSAEKKALTHLAQYIEKEYSQNIDKHSQDLIIANIDMMLKYCKRYYDRQFYTRTNLNKDILARFEGVMRDYYLSDAPIHRGVLSVKHCAQLLHLSPNYFGDLVKTETGRNAKDHIQDYIIEQAKNELLSSDLSVGEIAYKLGFEYPQGLNRLFKAKTGVSPTIYRNVN
ncbi:MAG: helix-turn-helix transcriptional regulator [Bacteroidota bacterium]